MSVVFLLTSPFQGDAQQVNVVQEIDGKPYFLHRVEEGHTLYAISKLYNVSIEEIIEANPLAAEGIKVGEVLKIPTKGSKPQETLKNPVRIEDGQLIHKVLRGETLFSISRNYNVDVNTILELNPETNTGLKKGQELIIPVNKVETDDLSDIEPAQEDSLIRHTVLQGETLYAIAKRYEVKITELQEQNKDILEVDGLQPGQVLRIPKVNETFELSTKEVTFEPVITDIQPLKEQYIIDLLLPFNLQSLNDSSDNRRSNRLREVAISMYRGALMAIDTLESEGLKAKLLVQDVSDRESLEKSALYSHEQEAHLVVGPLQRSLLTKAADRAMRSNIHIVCPVPQSNKILLGHSTLSKVNASSTSELDSLAIYLARNHKNANLILFNSGYTNDIRKLQLFQEKLEFELSLDESRPFLIREHSAEGKTVGDLENVLDTERLNIIVALTDNEVIIADMLRILGAVDLKGERKYEVEIYGTSKWMDLKFVDEEQREMFNLHFATSQFLNYSDPRFMNFVQDYIDRFQTYPDKYTVLTYDLLRFYGRGLIYFGTAFPAHFEEIDYKPLSIGFDYIKTGLESGYENENVFILEQEGYQLRIAGDESTERADR